MSRLEDIRELAIRNDVPFKDAMETYTRCSVRVYKRSVMKGEKLQLYNPVIEKRVFNLTDKYLGIKKWRDLNRGIHTKYERR